MGLNRSEADLRSKGLQPSQAPGNRHQEPLCTSFPTLQFARSRIRPSKLLNPEPKAFDPPNSPLLRPTKLLVASRLPYTEHKYLQGGLNN